MDYLCNLFNDCLYLFCLPFSFRDRLRWFRFRNWMDSIYNWNLLNSHICNLLSFFIKIINSLLRLWLFWSLWNDCKYFSKESFLRNNSLDVFILDFFGNLLQDNCVLRLNSFHDGWAGCSNSFSSFFSNGGLNCSWSDQFRNWLFICTNNFLILIGYDSNFFVFISNFRNCSFSDLLHYNSYRCHILNFSILSFNFLHDFLKMSIFFDHGLVYDLSNDDFFNNFSCGYLFSFFSFFSFNCVWADKFNFLLVFFISDCNKYFIYIWLAFFLNNNCSLDFVLWCFSDCW